ncbi:MAG: PAS domain S-box protein [Victivallales bacterium]|jgi:PAS domain S-box-containing protein
MPYTFCGIPFDIIAGLIVLFLIICGLYMLDLKVRKNNKLRMEQSEERYRMIADNTSDILVQFGMSGEICYVSPASTHMLGIAPDEMKSREISEFIHPDDKAVFDKIYAQQDASRLPPVTFRFKKNDNGYIWIESVNKVLYSQQDGLKVRQIISSWRDVSERKKNEDELQQYKLQLEKMVYDRTEKLNLVNESLVKEINDKKDIEMALQQQNTVLEAIGFCSEILLKLPDFEPAVTEALKQLGRSADLSLVYICENSTEDTEDITTSIRYEWCADGVPPHLPDPELQDLSYGEYGLSRWVELFRKGDNIHENMGSLPENEKVYFFKLGIRSLLAIPIRCADKWWGFIGLAENRFDKEWRESEIKILKNAADIIGAAIERQMMEAEFNMLVLAVEHSPASIVITDVRGNIQYANPKFTFLTGYALKEVIGKNASILKSGTHSPEYYREMWDAILSGGEWNGEFHNRKKNGELYWEFESISPIVTKGEITHFIGIKEDITERKEYEKHLREAKEMAESANRAKSEFLANMSHEIRTPMNSILGMAELLQTSTLSPDHQEYAAAICSSSKMLLTLINDILDMSKIEAGKIELHHEAVDILETIEDVAHLNSMAASEKGLRLILSFEPGTPRYLVGDAVRIRQVLINLAGNAVKFTDRGEVLIKASCIGRNLEFASIRIDVIDTGSGIPQEAHAHIFEKFTQLDASTTRRYGGTGLGLPICKKLMEIMNGEIGLESSPGNGSDFYCIFNLPVMQSPPTEEIIETAESLRILVADNNTASRNALCGQFSQWSLKYDEVTSYDAVLLKVRDSISMGKPYSICFVDQELPGLTNEATINLAGEINGNTQIVITSTSGIFPDSLKVYENMILMRRPLKISWLPDLINESILKRKRSDA